MTRPYLRTDPDTHARIAATGERLGIPDGAVVRLLSRWVDRLTVRDIATLPSETPGRMGQGRRKKAKSRNAPTNAGK